MSERGVISSSPPHLLLSMTSRVTADQAQLTWIASLIWNFVDDVLSDVHVGGEYRNAIRPVTVIRRLNVVLKPSKQQAREMRAQLDQAAIASREAHRRQADEGEAIGELVEADL